MQHLHPGRPSFPSDTGLLIDACIARVREAARLDDDAVLPPLPLLAPRREVAIFTRNEMAVATDAAARKTREASTESIARPKAKKRARWPLALCGFLAGAFACAAVLASPVGRRPDVAHATEAARGHAVSAMHATAVFFAR